MKKHLILLAGGHGTRMNASVNKILIPLCGKPVILRSMEAFLHLVDDIVIVAKPSEKAAITEHTESAASGRLVVFASGGHTRQESVYNGLCALNADPDDPVLIHDAARCLVDSEVITRVINAVMETGTGIPGIPVTSTYKICDRESMVIQTPDRAALYEIQTPQGFRYSTIMSLSEKARKECFEATDDAGLLEHFQVPVKVVPGSVNNIKLTTPDDLSRAKTILEGDSSEMRIGFGYDVHQLSENRKLILCGIEIPFGLGLLGHSDADVAIHALIDAMLGACSLGDIGKLFPDTDDQYKDISSAILLRKVYDLIISRGHRINNADITIVAQRPKLQPFIPLMKENIALLLKVSPENINIKATTTEHLGFEGRMEGISAYAVCTVN